MSISEMKSNKYVWAVLGVAIGVGIGYAVWGMPATATTGAAP